MEGVGHYRRRVRDKAERNSLGPAENWLDSQGTRARCSRCPKLTTGSPAALDRLRHTDLIACSTALSPGM